MTFTTPEKVSTDASEIALLLQRPEPSAPNSHYDRSEKLVARRDQEIARLPQPGNESAFRLGARVRLGDDGMTVLADCDGVVCFEDGKLWIEPIYQIDNNVDFSTGHVEFDGDVVIGGSVMDLFRVNSTQGSVRIGGAVEAAEVCAKVDLTVRGGIAAKDKGSCRSGRNLSCKFASNASLTAGQNVNIEAEVNNCRVTSGGKFDATHGSIVASQITAIGGVYCRTLGSPAGIKTFVEAGVDHEFQKQLKPAIAEIEALKAKALQFRQQAEPFVRNQKTLSAQQKEKVTELLFEADAVELEIHQRSEKLRAAQQASTKRSHSVVEVASIVHPGVTVRFSGIKATTSAAIRGPIQITPKLLRGALCVVALNTATGAQSILESTVLPEDPTLAAAKRTLGIGA